MKLIKRILEVRKDFFEEDKHVHFFEKEHYPKNMIPYIPDIIEKRIKDSSYIRLFLRLLNPFKSNDKLDWDANFLKIGDKKYNQQYLEYKQEMKKYFHETHSTTILTVDFEFMERGEVEKGLEDQLEKAILIKNLNPEGTVKVYMGIDPRRPNLLEMVHDYLPDIDGFKMYLYNGFFPYDERLNKIYDIAEIYDLEVVYHCSNTNINYYGGKDIKKLLKESKFPLLKNRSGNKELSTNFCNPKGIELVALRYPKVRFRIAHFGGEDMINNWSSDQNYAKEILRIIYNVPNVSTDIAYICCNKEAMNSIAMSIDINPNIAKKIKFGTDFYMCESSGGLKAASEILRS